MRTNRKQKKAQGLFGDTFAKLPIMASMIFSGLFLGYIFFTEDGVPLYLQTVERAERLEMSLIHMKEKNQFLEKEIHRVQSDPRKLEELARDRLGMVRKGETVYQFVEPRFSSSAPH